MQTRLSIQKRVGLNILKSGSNMGYYTAYSLTVKGDKKLVEQFENDLLQESGLDGDVKDLILDGSVYAKLYDLSDWITHISPKYPELLIILNGDGEESDDLWEERWRGSEHELQNAVIPPFENPNLWTDTEKEKQNNN